MAYTPRENWEQTVGRKTETENSKEMYWHFTLWMKRWNPVYMLNLLTISWAWLTLHVLPARGCDSFKCPFSILFMHSNVYCNFIVHQYWDTPLQGNTNHIYWLKPFKHCAAVQSHDVINILWSQVMLRLDSKYFIGATICICLVDTVSSDILICGGT